MTTSSGRHTASDLNDRFGAATEMVSTEMVMMMMMMMMIMVMMMVVMVMVVMMVMMMMMIMTLNDVGDPPAGSGSVLRCHQRRRLDGECRLEGIGRSEHMA
jgi:hypothetical protein